MTPAEILLAEHDRHCAECRAAEDPQARCRVGWRFYQDALRARLESGVTDDELRAAAVPVLTAALRAVVSELDASGIAPGPTPAVRLRSLLDRQATLIADSTAEATQLHTELMRLGMANGEMALLWMRAMERIERMRTAARDAASEEPAGLDHREAFMAGARNVFDAVERAKEEEQP